MKLTIHPVLRFIIGAVIFFLYIMGLVEWQWFDGLIRWFAPLLYLIAAVLGVISAAVCYALLPTKNTIKITESVLRASGKKDRVMGYLTWLACGIVFFVIWLPFYINEM